VTCVNSAQATIHYSGIINQKFIGGSHEHFQLDQPDHTIVFTHVRDFEGGSAFFSISAEGGLFAGFYACAFNSSIASVSRLQRGHAVSARPFVANFHGILATTRGQSCGGGNRGQFRFVDGGFIGFKWNGGSGDQYGWARVQMGGNRNFFKLIDYAYGDVGDRIRAGQISSDEMVPEEGSLGWLALGAAGLLAWRKSRSRAPR
jgi:hypothetical protein